MTAHKRARTHTRTAHGRNVWMEDGRRIDRRNDAGEAQCQYSTQIIELGEEGKEKNKEQAPQRGDALRRDARLRACEQKKDGEDGRTRRAAGAIRIT
jgi:hypothetical protein